MATCLLTEKAQCNALQAILNEMSFSCGAPLQDLDLPSDLINNVYVRDMNCQEYIHRSTLLQC